MNKNFTLKKWAAESTGVSVTVHGISIHAELYGQESNGILLYDSEDAEPVRIDFTDEMKLGSTYRCLLSGSSLREYTYLFHEDGKPVTDLLAKRLSGHRYFGEEHLAAGKKDALKRCVFVADQFNWQGDKKPGTAYEDSVYYGMHVRGFTKDASSRVKEAGTFAGIQKKIPYLKKLGITGIVLQPVYEFEECMKKTEARTAEALALQPAGEPQTRLNYWGYLPGYYLAPKNAYAYSDDAVTELKTLVRQLHKNSLEVILQFYFEPYMSSVRIREILLYWLKNYHIDGFELMGAQLPLREIALEPEFSEACPPELGGSASSVVFAEVLLLPPPLFPSETGLEQPPKERAAASRRERDSFPVFPKCFTASAMCFLKMFLSMFFARFLFKFVSTRHRPDNWQKSMPPLCMETYWYNIIAHCVPAPQ